MLKAAVIGRFVDKSLSPQIFSLLAKRLGKKLCYEKRSLQPSELAQTLAGYIGCNVTSPYKEAVIPLLDCLSPEAKKIGAVNVVHGKSGHNTDYLGIIETLKDHNVAIKAKSCLIYGAGGAARAAVYALKKCMAGEIFICNKTFERCKNLGATPLSSPRNCPKPVSLLLNTTPAPESFFELPPLLASDVFAFDLLYLGPAPFLEKTKAFKQCNGLEMLIWQALYTWEIWFGPQENKQELKKWLLSELQKKNIYLTGFMGAGKTTVGKILAKSLGKAFVDLDCEIEKAEGKAISEIFSQRGEDYFRNLESRHLAMLSKKRGIVVALGGGTAIHSLDGKVIYLQADPKMLLKRIKGTKRPLLKGKTDREIYTLFQTRQQMYEIADIVLNTERLTPKQITEKLLQQIDHAYI